MGTALVILGSVLTFAAIGSGFAKLARVPQVMESMASVGVSRQIIPILAVLEISGGAGVILGIWIPWLGTLSAACLSLYFFGAVSSHLRKKHGIAGFGPAFFLFLIAVATTLLQFNR